MSPQQPDPSPSPDVKYLERALDQMRTDVVGRIDDVRSDLRRMVSAEVWRAEQRNDHLRMDHIELQQARQERDLAAAREDAERRAREIETAHGADRDRAEATRRLLWTTLLAPLVVAALLWLLPLTAH